MFSMGFEPFFMFVLSTTSAEATQNLLILGTMHYSNEQIWNISFGGCFSVFIHLHGKEHPNEHSNVLFHTNSGDMHNLICGPYVSITYLSKNCRIF